MIQFNQAVRFLLPSAKVIVIVPAVFGGYALVKLEGLTSLFCAIYALDTACILELLLSVFAEQDIRSRELLQGLKRRVKGSRRSVAWKELAAMRPIAVTVGNGSYFVDKQLVLTVLEIIASNTVNAILL